MKILCGNDDCVFQDDNCLAYYPKKKSCTAERVELEINEGGSGLLCLTYCNKDEYDKLFKEGS